MKIKYLLPLLCLVTCLFYACQKVPTFPDPGFKLENQDVEVRRDTADFYTVKMQMEVPNGVDNIEVLNATNYELVESISAYAGKKNFEFNYEIDLRSFEKDTVLYYIFKVTDQDKRSFNRGFTLSVKRLSFPEIRLVGGTSLNVVVPVYQLKGLISTGLNELESVQVLFKNEEQYAYIPGANEAVYEYILSEQIGFGTLVAGEEYPLDIIIKDRKGQTSITTIMVRKSDVLKQPVGINVYTYSGRNLYFGLEYDELHRVSKITKQWENSDDIDSYLLSYNEMGCVDTITYLSRYESDYYQEYGLNQYGHVYKYKEGTAQLDQILYFDIFYNDNGSVEIRSNYEIESQNFQYNENGILTSYYGESATHEMQYTDPFNTGEFIFADYWQFDYYNILDKNRQHRTDFVPLYMPSYLEGLPPFLSLSDKRYFSDIFFSKYVFTGTQHSSDEYTGTYLEEPNYKYETDADGNLITFTKNYLYNGWKPRAYVYTFKY
ncbi:MULTISPECIES: hypothetical protein [unclassified Carboxylicivirga]|uniref:hypothetical protein n=1 Tax=Carboxylicivirga TaxID=1628153 RepID=UPI003D358417